MYSAINAQNNLNAQIARNQPYMDLGTSSINPLRTAMGYNADGSVDPNNILQQQFHGGTFTAPTAAEAQATPGYQFTLDQGLQGVQNSAAARGLGTSGAAMKGAASYASGLADSTYNDVYNRALNTFNTNFNTGQSQFNTNYNAAAGNAQRLQGLVNSGQNAANLSQAAVGTSGVVGGALGSAGSAAAQGMVGSAAANASGMNTLGNSLMTAASGFNNASSGNTGANPLQTGIANMSDDPIGTLNTVKGWT